VRRKDALNHLLDQASGAALRFVSRLPGSKHLRQSLISTDRFTPIESPWATKLMTQLIPVLCIAFALTFVTRRLIEYGSWPPAVYHGNDVYNLTARGIAWDVHYGPSKGCQTDACYVDPRTPAAYFLRREVLPLREFPLRGWQDDRVVYYRTALTIPQSLLSTAGDTPLSIHTILMFAKSWDFYVNGTLVFQGTQETMLVTIPRPMISSDGRVDLAIIARVDKLPYQGIANRGDLVIGPRSLLAPLSFFARDNSTSLQLIYLLPKLTFCLVFSILFVFLRSNQEIVWFLIYGLTSSLELFFRSDYASQLGINGETTELLALMTRNYALLAFVRFIYAFFRLQNRKLLRFMNISLIALTLVNAACFGFFSYAATTKALDIIAIILKPCVYLFSIMLAVIMAGLLSTESRARLRSRIALSFAVLLTFGAILAFIDLTRLIAGTFGISWHVTIVNLTWVFDLILFVYMAIVIGLELAVQHAQKQQIADKLQNLNERLELASTVQSTLLPRPQQGVHGSLKWNSFYVAAERLAGDWIFLSDNQHHSKRFFLGDVTGKGPAAAIAVAAIISLLKKKDFEPSLMTDTLAELNAHLFHLFRGKVSSAVCLAEIDETGKARLISNGMTGWIHLSQGKARMIQTRGSILGASDHMDISVAEIHLNPGDYLVCFSDGCLEGQRALRRLCSELEKMLLSAVSAETLFQTVIRMGQDTVMPDDKAMLVIQKTA
jgi:hypothetical protein